MVCHCGFHNVSKGYLARECVVLFWESYQHSQELCPSASFVNSFQLDSAQAQNVCFHRALPTTAHFQEVQLNEIASIWWGFEDEKKAIFGERWKYSAWKSNPYSHRLGVEACIFLFYFQAPPAFWFDSFMCGWRTLSRLPCRYCVKLMRKPGCLRGEVF